MNIALARQELDRIWDHLAPFLLLSVLMLLAAIAFVRMKRPTANAKCFIAVLFSLAPWLGMTGWMTLVGITSAMKSDGEDGLIIWAGFIMLWLASPVLAVLGLLELRRKPGKYVEGKGAAIATLVQVGFLASTFALARYLDRANVDDTPPNRMMLAWVAFSTCCIMLFPFFKWGVPAYRRWLRDLITRLQK
jgi:hypothetical protein